MYKVAILYAKSFNALHDILVSFFPTVLYPKIIKSSSHHLHSRRRYSATWPFFGLLFLCQAIQPRQICLPTDGNNPGEDAPVFYGYKRKIDGGDGGPQLDRVDHTGWNSSLDAVPDFGQVVARKEGLHAEEVRVEQRRKDGLVNDDLGSEREEARRVVEIARQEHEPIQNCCQRKGSSFPY